MKAVAFGLISPDIHSILICGASGTGKSVAARAVRGIAPGKELVELPIDLSLEQLFGAVDIERTIKEGTLAFSKSVLSRADGNVLIADNINLQSPEVLYSLMNSVQDGTMLSEMNGLSVSAMCDTLLIQMRASWTDIFLIDSICASILSRACSPRIAGR